MSSWLQRLARRIGRGASENKAGTPPPARPNPLDTPLVHVNDADAFRVRHVLRRTPAAPRRIGDIPLFQFSPEDVLTVEDACQGILSTGGVGSGKTTGSCEAMLRACLRAQMGGLICCAKADDARRIRQICAEEDRADDLIVVSQDGDHRLNVFEYEYLNSGRNVPNVTQLLTQALEIGDRSTKNVSDPFWLDSQNLVLTMGFLLQVMAGSGISLSDLHEILQSAPRSLEEAQSQEWLNSSSACALLLQLAEIKTRNDPDLAHDLQRVKEFFTQYYPAIPEKTRNTIVTGFVAATAPFLTNPMHRLFCTHSTWSPEDCFDRGKIVLLDLSLKTYGFTGRFAQVLIKMIFLSAAERRKGDDLFPAFLHLDEGHLFITKSDQQAFTTTRSARIIPIVATQSVCNIYAEFPGNKDAANALLNTLNLRLYHRNGCVETNELAIRSIGQDWQQLANFSTGSSNGVSWQSENENRSVGFSQQLAPDLVSRFFQSLPSGGKAFNYEVHAVAFRSGAPWHLTGKQWMVVSFSQLHPRGVR